MGTKKNYMNLLKEAISEFDTSKTQSIKGPMLDPILSWEGDGELPTYKDAGSILERYYFNENNDEEIETLDEADYENDKGGDGKGMKHAQGDAGPQAGTSDKKNIKAVKGEIEDEIDTQGTEVNDAKKIKQELDDIEALGDNLAEADDADADDADADDADDSEDVKEELAMENEIIEKLIAEMEADDDAQGAGTQQAGTGDADKLVPDRKDEEKTSVKAKNYNEDNDLIEAALSELEDEIADEKDDDDDDKEEKELDVDKEVSEAAASAVPGGPSPKKTGEDYEEDEAAYSEAFNIFKEAIEDDEE